MKKGIHPQVYTDAIITCACGNSFTTTSTRQTIVVDICSNCHPFFTGQQRFVDTEGRIDKFAKKIKIAQDLKAQTDANKGKKAAKKTSSANNSADNSPTLKDLLQKAKKLTEEETEN